MIKIPVFLLLLVPVISPAQKINYTIRGKVTPLKTSTHAYLQYIKDGGYNTDSAPVKNGIFEFKGFIEAPVKALLTLDHHGVGLHPERHKSSPDEKVIYIDKEHIRLTAADSIKNSVITGSAINNEYLRYRASFASTQEAMALAEAAPFEGDATIEKMEKISTEERTLQILYARQNRNSYFSLETLTAVSDYGINANEIGPIFNNLSPKLRTSKEGIAFARILDVAKRSSVGNMAPDFIQNDVHDRPVKLSDFKGKYILVDFWASWCKACRMENPKILKAYNEYNQEGFTVLGVSLDRPGKKDQWLQAITADSLVWTQVSDLKDWDNAVAKLYGIKSIPQNFLIDPTGKVIGKNLSGEELTEKLAMLLGNK